MVEVYDGRGGGVWWEGLRCVEGIGGVWQEGWRCVEGVEKCGGRGEMCGGRGGVWWEGYDVW